MPTLLIKKMGRCLALCANLCFLRLILHILQALGCLVLFFNVKHMEPASKWH